MRRFAVVLALPLLAVGVLAGCGSSSSPTTASPVVKVSGAFGQAPSVTIPEKKAGGSLVVKTVIHGTGQTLKKTDAFVGHYALYVWSGRSHRLLGSSFPAKKNSATPPTLFAGTFLPGLEKALVGQKMGSRVLAVVPPKQAFGSAGNPQAGIKGTDTLVFVVDMIKDFPDNASASGTKVSAGGGGLPTVAAAPGSQPTLKMPSAKPPSSLVTKVLVKGSGPAVAKGQTVVVQYVGAIWQSGKVFDASWSRHQPFGFTIGATPSQVISGWDKGLIGQTVGSRVMLVVPPADGYGKNGNSSAGISGTDTLVFVVDVLGAFSPS